MNQENEKSMKEYWPNAKSLMEHWSESGDIRVLLGLIEKYNYTMEDVSDVINCYEDLVSIPEVEHIETMLQYFPEATVSDKTMSQIKTSYPRSYEYIKRLKKM